MANRASSLEPRRRARACFAAVAWLSVAASAEPPNEAARAYPKPGRTAGTTAFSHEDAAEPQASAGYPSWFRGNGPDGMG